MPDDVNELGTTPLGTTANNIPAHVQLLKDSINTGSLGRRLTSAQIAALPAAQKPIGVFVVNTTTGNLQKWDGTKWEIYARADQFGDYVRATRSTPQGIASGGSGYRVTFESETGTLISALDTSAGTFTVPSSGLWAVTLAFEWDVALSDIPGAVSNYGWIRNHTTGVNHAKLAASLTYVSLCAVVYAAASDVLDFCAYQASGSTRYVNSAELTVAPLGPV